MALRYPVPPIVQGPAANPAPRPKRRAEGWIRITVPGVMICFMLCMFGKAFVGDTFVLRTSSMEPTIVGRRAGGDRVILSRLHTLLREPDRWEILLFRYPNNVRTHYMKRLVGLPGEQIFIRGGDLYRTDATWSGTLNDGLRLGRVAILRKPARVRDSLVALLPVIAEEELEDFDAELFRRHCEVVTGGEESWSTRDDHVVVEAGDLCLVRLRREARDLLFDVLGDPDRRTAPKSVGGGKYQCGDLSLRLEARPEKGTGCVVVEIDDQLAGRRLRAEIAVEGGRGRTTLSIDDVVIARSDVRLDADSWTDIGFANVDDRVRLLIDGDEVLVRDYGHATVETEAEEKAPASRVRFGARDGTVALRPISLHRDLYYVAEGQTRFLVPDGHLLFLGDNSASSADARSWKRVAVRVVETGEVLHGDVQGVTPTSILLHDGNPWQEPDGTWTFADLVGNLHKFEEQTEWRRIGTWPTPYVRRDWVLGRGMCVLSPISRFSWLR
ncbi:MAG: signal peptidase I [Planctomycetes bacterium]|nr:signal peptidase I [Planctomycetota bacterium]